MNSYGSDRIFAKYIIHKSPLHHDAHGIRLCFFIKKRILGLGYVSLTREHCSVGKSCCCYKALKKKKVHLLFLA